MVYSLHYIIKSNIIINIKLESIIISYYSKVACSNIIIIMKFTFGETKFYTKLYINSYNKYNCL